MSFNLSQRASSRFGLIWVGIAAILFALGCQSTSNKVTKVRYGITPYQDSALPVVADKLGWYEKSGVQFTLVPLAWGDVITALSSGSIDVAVYNFNSFLPPYENAIRGNRRPLFYCPLYVFKGQAIMVRGDAGYTTFHDLENESDSSRSARLSQIAKQLQGKRIAVTQGTELEQIVLQALAKAKLDPTKDVTLIHSSPEDALAAFLAKSVDAFAAGLTERTEARRHGAVELLVTADVTLPVIDGIITTEEFARQHQPTLDSLVCIWFRTIEFMTQDLQTNSSHILDYLAKSASTRYTPDEYAVAWTFNIFPGNISEADRLFHDRQSPYYWKRSWDSTNAFLFSQRKIASAISVSAYAGESTLRRLSAK